MSAFSKDDLQGSFPPLVTPIRDGAVDFDAYTGLVQQHVAAKTHGIVVNGTTAEPSTLTVQERNDLVLAGVEAADAKFPVVAATGSQSLAETLALTEAATKAGADAVMVVTPYYIKPPQRGIAAYFKEVSNATDLPILMYHIPGRAGVSVTLETLQSIADDVPTFCGMKHASMDLALVSESLMAFGPDFKVFVGLEELSFPMLCLGASGMMNAAGNLRPDDVADLYEAVRNGDLDRARALHYDLWDLNRAIFFDTNPIPLKHMMKRLGFLAHAEHRLPMMPATPELEGRLDELLVRGGLLARAA